MLGTKAAGNDASRSCTSLLAASTFVAAALQSPLTQSFDHRWASVSIAFDEWFTVSGQVCTTKSPSIAVAEF